VVGVGLAGSLDEPERAFRWTQGGGFEALGAPAGFVTSQANDISNDSSVIVGRAGGTGLPTTAFRWTQSDGIQSMGLGPFTGTAANAVSSDGSVIVGDATRPGAFSVPFRWDETNGYSEIPGLSPFFAFSRAFDVSSDGTTIVGWSFNTQNQIEAFRWREDTGTLALGAFDPGTFTRESFATGVSGDGKIIVGGSRAPDTQRAFLWTEPLGFTDLQTHLETDYGIDFLGWTLEEASGISDDGTVISGWGFDPNGVRTGWIVTIPTPASVTLLSLGLLAGARKRR
jgi:probable HAF family extracellular repeat protein